MPKENVKIVKKKISLLSSGFGSVAQELVEETPSASFNLQMFQRPEYGREVPVKEDMVVKQNPVLIPENIDRIPKPSLIAR